MLKIYRSEDKKEEVEVIQFGRVEAGSKGTIKLYVYNDTPAWVYSIMVGFTEKDVQIVDFPKSLRPWEGVWFELVWSPPRTLKKGLKGELELDWIEEYKP